ncbi:flagellar basal body P-ring protein FlgI [Seohaeicola saemankumensis]|uniref:flagellar basal body P-ring protein FlgI n=1 Tax=Seohaeicola saemankumensis TaxID=481181 RepID=UPI003AF40A36
MSVFRLCMALAVVLLGAGIACADRLKDLASVSGVRSNQLIGYGVVVGLLGTGDGNSGLTLQSLESLISRLGLQIEARDLNTKNAAAVMVTADLGPFLKEGQVVDVTVSAIGQSKSLRGGTLLMTPLMGADGEIYAIAQGNLVVGGLGVDGNDGSSLTVNIPTVGRIPGGATVERIVETPYHDTEFLVLNLHRPDFSTAAAVAQAINTTFGDGTASPVDASSIAVRAPSSPSQRVAFTSLLESVEVTPDAPRARVVVNSRTGTVVIGGEVKVTPAAVTHGSLTVRVTEDMKVTRGNTVIAGPGGTVVVPDDGVANPDSQIAVLEEPARAFVFDPGVSLASLVDAINAVGATPSDLVAILEALREVGALRAELVVI